MEYRPYYLAREWVRLGHRVRIVAADQSHIRARRPELGGHMRLDETIDGVEYTWHQTPSYSGNGVGRVRNMLAFVRLLYREGRKLALSFKPDIVIASSTYPMDIWPARRIAGLARAKLVFEVHDLWPLSPMELGGMSKWHPFIMLLQAAEDYAYRHADLVVSMLPKVHAHMASRGLSLDKLHVIPNGVDPEEWGEGNPALPSDVVETLTNLRDEGRTLIGYAGTHGVANAMEIFLSAAALMKDEPLAFVLVGGGPDKAMLQRLARAENLNNVHFIDPVQKQQIPALLQWFDIAYIGWKRHPLYRFGIAPNKLMDYMMAARPVLHAVEGGNDPVGEARCGMTVVPEDPQAIANGLRSLLALDAAQREAMGQRGRAFVLKNHVYPVLGRKFIDACGISASRIPDVARV